MFLARHPAFHPRIPLALATRNAPLRSARSFVSTSCAMAKLSAAIKDDHKELEEFYNNTLNATTQDEKDRWRNQLTWELARHAVGEELVLYPAMEKYLANGKELADHDRQEHAKASFEVCSYLRP
jgi:Hemerythrin HHE cation binding domain